MSKIRPSWVLAALAFALLSGCGKSDHSPASPTANVTPAKSVLVTVNLLKQGQFDALMKHVLPPADYQHMRDAWKAQHAHMKDITDKDRQQFAESMQRVTAPDAEQNIWAQVEPKLKEMDKQYKARMPMMIGMGQVMLDTQISNSDQLTPDQKKQATGVVDAISAWAQQTNWLDADKLKQAIGVVTATARKLDLKTLDQAVALSYDQALAKYGVVWGGAKQVLGVYGLSIDKTLDSATAKTVRSDDHTATVEVTYTLLGKPQSMSVDMVKLDDRWYDKDLLDHWRKVIDNDLPAAAGSSVAAAAASTAATTPAKPATAAGNAN